MPVHKTADQIRDLAQKHLHQGTALNDSSDPSGHIQGPVEVQGTDGKLHSWFVPVTVGDLLTGFFQFLADGTFMRYSSFQRRANEFTGCPLVADWLDQKRISARIGNHRLPDEQAGKPFLTFDKTPDRLVWAVPLKDPAGKVRFVYVAGSSVYLPTQEETYD